jgi:hypothetical protein
MRAAFRQYHGIRAIAAPYVQNSLIRQISENMKPEFHIKAQPMRWRIAF